MLPEIDTPRSFGCLEAMQRMHSRQRRHSTRQSDLPSFKLNARFHPLELIVIPQALDALFNRNPTDAEQQETA